MMGKDSRAAAVVIDAEAKLEKSEGSQWGVDIAAVDTVSGSCFSTVTCCRDL